MFCSLFPARRRSFEEQELTRSRRLSLIAQYSAVAGDVSDQDKKILVQLNIASVQNCVEYAVSIISMAHSITIIFLKQFSTQLQNEE